MVHSRSRIEIAIAIFKLCKAAVLLAVVVLIVIARDHLGVAAAQAASALGLSGNRLVTHMSVRLGQVDRNHVPWLAAGVLAYAGVFSVEGVGLVRGRRWAEWMTAIVTASFVPIEIVMAIRHESTFKLVLTAVNLAIVVYLAVRLRRGQRE